MAQKKQMQLILSVFRGADGAVFALERIRTGQVRSNNHVILERDATGTLRVKEAKDMGASKGAVIGAVAGVLLPGVGTIGAAIAGGLAAKIHDAGLPDEQLRDLGEHLAPSSSALILLVEPAASEMAEKILRGAGGTIVAVGPDADLAAATIPTSLSAEPADGREKPA
jgi:uncharacterized membrane protein